MPAAPPKVVDALQRSVSLHLTAIEHYQSLAEHLSRWGYSKLAARYRDDVLEERNHLHNVMSRLEFFNVQPTYEHAAPSWPRADVPGILASSLTLENAAAAAERENIAAARSVGDEGTAVVFVDLLSGSERAIRDIESDLFLIDQMGLDNWLSDQVGA